VIQPEAVVARDGAGSTGAHQEKIEFFRPWMKNGMSSTAFLPYSRLAMDSASIVYQITRYGIPSSAGFYRRSGEFIQVFPSKRLFPDKVSWLRAWDLFGDEQVVAQLRRPISTRAIMPA
jgi:hypothetical protein